MVAEEALRMLMKADGNIKQKVVNSFCGNAWRKDRLQGKCHQVITSGPSAASSEAVSIVLIMVGYCAPNKRIRCLHMLLVHTTSRRGNIDRVRFGQVSCKSTRDSVL